MLSFHLFQFSRLTYPFLWFFFAWLCWDEFLDSEIDVSDMNPRAPRVTLTGHCDGMICRMIMIWLDFRRCRCSSEVEVLQSVGAKRGDSRHIIGCAIWPTKTHRHPANAPLFRVTEHVICNGHLHRDHIIERCDPKHTNNDSCMYKL